MMGTSKNQVDNEITNRVGNAFVAGSPNRITTRELQVWAVEYLQDNDEELVHFPSLAGEPHWNLWMMGIQPDDALFAVLIFRSDRLEFFCGTGNAHDIKTFAESEFPDDVDRLFELMRARFSIPQGSVSFERHTAEAWLGRPWG